MDKCIILKLMRSEGSEGSRALKSVRFDFPSNVELEEFFGLILDIARSEGSVKELQY